MKMQTTATMATAATPFTNGALAAATDVELLQELGRRQRLVDERMSADVIAVGGVLWSREDVAYALVGAGCDIDAVKRYVLDD